MDATFSDPLAETVPLYPRTVKPASKRLPIHRFLLELIRNPLRIIPEAAYREPIVVRPRRGSSAKAAWITDPNLIEEVLLHKVEDLRKSELEKRVLARSLGDGILTSDGQLWRWQRRIMAPLFRASEIRNYVPIMSRAGEEQVDRWRTRGSGWRRIDRDMTETTFAVIARAMLGGREPSETQTIKRDTETYLSYVSWEIAFTIMGFPKWLPHPGSLPMHLTARRLRHSVKNLIDRRKSEIDAGFVSEGDLLARLLSARDPESGEPMTEPQLVNNLLTLLEAGHETTAKALTWTLYLLALAPDWQTRLRAEIQSVTKDSTVKAEHLPRLVQTQQVLKESMRLFPPAPSMSRVFRESATVGGVHFEPNDLAIFPIYCIHRHKKLWADPDRFDPDRFTPEREKTYPRTQYMPFSAGPRICIGNTFAMTEAIAILATFLKAAQFDWDGKKEPEPISRITLRPKGGIRLLVTLI